MISKVIQILHTAYAYKQAELQWEGTQRCAHSQCELQWQGTRNFARSQCGLQWQLTQSCAHSQCDLQGQGTQVRIASVNCTGKETKLRAQPV